METATSSRLRIFILIIIIIFRYSTCCAGQADPNGAQERPQETGGFEEVKGSAEESVCKNKAESKDAFTEMLDSIKRWNTFFKKRLCPQKKVVDIDGDIILGGLMTLKEEDEDQMCGRLMPAGIQELEAILYTIDKVNAMKDFLPGIKLGAYILDDCGQVSYSYMQAHNFIQDSRYSKLLNESAFRCPDGESYFRSPNVAGVIRSETKWCRVAELLEKYKIPQVIFSDTNVDFTKSPEFEYLLTTVPSNKNTAEIIFLHLLFSRSFVSAVNENDYESRLLMEEGFLRTNISIPLNLTFSDDSSSACNGYHDDVAEVLMSESKSQKVIIGSQADIDGVMKAVGRSPYTKSVLDVNNSIHTSIFNTEIHYKQDESFLILKYVTPSIAGFKDYFKSLNVTTNKRNPWFAEYWEQTFSCKLPETRQTPVNRFAKECSGKEDLSTVEGLEMGETLQYASRSVLAFAYAIKSIHADLCDGEPGVCDKMKPLKGNMMLKYLKDTSFKGLNGDYFEIKKKRDEPSEFKIFHLDQKDPKKCEFVSGVYYQNVTFVNLLENFHFEKDEYRYLYIDLNETVMTLTVTRITTDPFAAGIKILAIAFFLSSGLWMCRGVLEKVEEKVHDVLAIFTEFVYETLRWRLIW